MLTIFAIPWWFQSLDLFRSVSTSFVTNFGEKIGLPEIKHKNTAFLPSSEARKSKKRHVLHWQSKWISHEKNHLYKNNNYIFSYICIVVIQPPQKNESFPKGSPRFISQQLLPNKKNLQQNADEKPDKSKVLISSCNSSCKAIACKSSSESLGCFFVSRKMHQLPSRSLT